MTINERAYQIWPVLVSAAKNHQVLTYKCLAAMIGMGSGTLAGSLGRIMKYCDAHELPPLTVLVTNEKIGLPGHGLTTSKNFTRDRERVFRHEWFKILPPTVSQYSSLN
jgi:alkylated DNA nucleotide flippase Atl1